MFYFKFFFQANFSRGLSFGTEDFLLDDLDPLKKWRCHVAFIDYFDLLFG